MTGTWSRCHVKKTCEDLSLLEGVGVRVSYVS